MHLLLSIPCCSVAIMSDAAHMLSDVSAFLVSIFATWAATQPSSWHYSFGYHRAEILGALVSVLTIWAVTGALVFEAFQRTMNPVRVDGKCECPLHCSHLRVDSAVVSMGSVALIQAGIGRDQVVHTGGNAAGYLSFLQQCASQHLRAIPL